MVSQVLYDGLRRETVRHIAKYKIFPNMKDFHWEILGDLLDWEDPIVKAHCILKADAYVNAIERKIKIQNMR